MRAQYLLFPHALILLSFQLPRLIRLASPKRGTPRKGRPAPRVSSPSPAKRVERGKPHSGSGGADRKSTRLNSSHLVISYAVFCLKKKTLCPLQFFSGFQPEPFRIISSSCAGLYVTCHCYPSPAIYPDLGVVDRFRSF